MSIAPDLSTIREAQILLRNYFGVTPLVKARSLARADEEAWLKIETGLPTGSFKPRGALFGLATALKRQPVEEVTACSTGNHGAAVAFAAKTLGVRATIFLPENPNPVKRRKIEDLGARVVMTGSVDLVDAARHMIEYSARPGVYFLNDSTDPDLPAGPGTIGLELLEQLPELTSVYVPMGDTALIRGVGAAIKQVKPLVQIIGVQAERAPSYVLSWRANKPVPTDSCDTCADGLATRMPDAQNVAAIRKVVDDVVLVSEEQMVAAVRHLYREEGVLAEPSGAATTAAWLHQRPVSGRAALLVTGGNISDAIRKQAGI
jgi:threonine dehydratase